MIHEVIVFSAVTNNFYLFANLEPGQKEHADPNLDTDLNSWLTNNLKDISKLDY